MDYPGRDIRCRGRVTQVFERDGESLVELDVWTEDPDGAVTTPGQALVALPARERDG
jgi:hypothetical protein